ncbi:MAG: metallophosphoesterase, partial [Muribaculaceae bacterium]|nr:metallophosphoesterase [Muribaculaceae bacterium]
MKLIHTSDWHLGHQLYGYDRTEEFLHFFRRLDEIIKKESPDALLVSGDIFDVSAPSAGVSKMFKDRLLML